MNQEFYNSVGQVAGGDIHNYMLNDLSGQSREEIAALLVHLRERLSDARRRIFINPIVGWMALGFLAFAVEVLSGVAFSYSWLLFGTLLLGIVVPYLFFIPIQKKYGPLVYTYRESISTVEIFQHSRGWS
ncbi:hypothetical protein [Pseudomonas fluorescens]|uniref:Uncharacterized protein n=1 Tax=Pseudomonas fluorescens TaxID=294 RepID=A0A944HE93_PSEFL|nr:hypothetical protein [Pseudomonas fluorescens]MBT2294532.1 hypothetical protein [Pseudomonas fluorescens]MBT2306812.1 hypothetical protein [Pseudomonas fluorescens]MBT2316278.1 hypothetical protein [Pseudomonas fluorescens]MBT2331615.1 hypothetical protein [Pseudomonas fluorescens]MBT2342783.1 hypothetical protein [Pseudomonas fluorescens]